MQSYYVYINCFVSFSILITPVMKSENKGIIIYNYCICQDYYSMNL